MNDKLKICILGNGKLLEVIYAHLLWNTEHDLYIHMPEDSKITSNDIRHHIRGHSMSGGSPNRAATTLSPTDPIEGYDAYWVGYDDVTQNGILMSLAVWFLEATGGKPVVFSSPLTPDAANSLCNALGDVSKFVYHPIEHYAHRTIGRNTQAIRRGYFGAVDPDSAKELMKSLGVDISDTRCVSIELAAKTYLARQYKAMMSQIMENEVGNILGNDYQEFRALTAQCLGGTRPLPQIGLNDDCLLKTMPILRQTYNGDDVLYSALHSTIPRNCDVIVESVQKAWQQVRERFPGEVVSLYLYGVTSEISGSGVDHSYAMEVLLKLLQWSEGVNVYVIDPHVDVNADNRLLQYRMVKVEESYEQKACRVVLVDHPEFKDGHDLGAFNLVYSGLRYKPTLF